MSGVAVHKHDVVILGAGFAGLTLARQLRRRRSDLDIAVVEHREFPVANATHKVGESTVEIASHYLGEELGLRDHLEREQLPKVWPADVLARCRPRCTGPCRV